MYIYIYIYIYIHTYIYTHIYMHHKITPQNVEFLLNYTFGLVFGSP